MLIRTLLRFLAGAALVSASLLPGHRDAEAQVPIKKMPDLHTWVSKASGPVKVGSNGASMEVTVINTGDADAKDFDVDVVYAHGPVPVAQYPVNSPTLPTLFPNGRVHMDLIPAHSSKKIVVPLFISGAHGEGIVGNPNGWRGYWEMDEVIIVDSGKKVAELNETDNVEVQGFRAVWDVPDIDITGVTVGPGVFYAKLQNTGNVDLPPTEYFKVEIEAECFTGGETGSPLGGQVGSPGRGDAAG